MNHNAPLSPRPLSQLSDVRQRVLTIAQLRAHGVTTAEIDERCRPGGGWQQVLPGVVVLHPAPATGEERLHATLRYAARSLRESGVPVQPAGTGPAPAPQLYPDAMITGLAALALYRFTAAPSLLALDRIDVLVPRLRRLRSAGFARIVRTSALPETETVLGIPVAPAPRALADAVAELDDAAAVRQLLTEAVRGRHCEPAAVVRELSRARLLGRPHVVDAVDSLLAEGRAIAEDRLYRMVREHGLPDPLWHVALRLPSGPGLGTLDAYWPEQAVALELDTRSPCPGRRPEDDPQWAEYARRHERLERLGITVVGISPKTLRESLERPATIVRTALMAAAGREPAAHVVVLPR